MLNRTFEALQKGFMKHGADFGLSGNWNPGRVAEFSRALHQFMNSLGVQMVHGTYRGDPVTHYLDLSTGLSLTVDLAGNYVSTWTLRAAQLQHVLTTGNLQ